MTDLTGKTTKELKEMKRSFETTSFYSSDNGELVAFCKQQISDIESQLVIRKSQEKAAKSERLAYEEENYLELFFSQEKKMYQSETLKSKAQAKFFAGKLRKAVKSHRKMGLEATMTEDKIEGMINVIFIFEKKTVEIFIGYGSNGYKLRIIW